MTGVDFRLAEKDAWPGCREIAVEGELDLAVSDRLRAAIARASDEQRHVLLDLSGCDFIDASGLAVLIGGHWCLRERGCQLLLHAARGQVRRLLSLTGVTESGLMATTAAPGVIPAPWSDRFETDQAERIRASTA